MADASPALPSGTVTFLFSDVEGSTRLWEDDPDGMARALERHDEILRDTIEVHGGYVFSTAGDAFSAAFFTASDAVATAIEAQRLLGAESWPESARLRVRMGAHTGDAYERDGDYFGSSVNRAARIMSAGHGGQILVSEATAGLLSIADVDLRAAGMLSLRGLSQPETVSQVLADGLLADFPPLRSQLSVGNLPPDRDLFVGREREVSELTYLSRSHRLVTLTGAGGVGKTRLATTCGWRWSDEYPDGVWLVSLAEIGDDDEVAHAVARTAGLRTQPALSVVDSVVEVLSNQRVLLILDNCEHVLDGAAELAEALLSQTGRAALLATSREGLGVPGERLVAIRSLASQGLGAEAIELFIDRATAAGWTQTDVDLAAVAELCQRLDGMPLAIELAAARARSLPVTDMLARLDDRFRLLAGRRRRVERHQTLRATVSWSYDLLTDGERRLFDRLSVFAGPFTLAAAEAVCVDAELDPLDVDDHLSALVDKSMVISDDGWYRLLETLSQYGAEQLASRADPERFRQNHLQHFTNAAVEAHDGLWGPDEPTWIDRLERTWGNYRAAIERAIETRDPEATSVLLAHLGGYMNMIGTEVGPWVENALAIPGVESCRFYPAMIASAGFGAIGLNDLSSAFALAERAQAALNTGGTDLDQTVAVLTGNTLALRGEPEKALDAFRAGADGVNEEDQPALKAWVLAGYAFALGYLGRTTESAEVARPAVDLADNSRNPTAQAFSRYVLGAALLDDDPEQAGIVLEQALEVSDRPTASHHTGSQARLARIRSSKGEHQLALSLALEAVTATRRTGNWGFLWNQLMYMAFVLEAAGETEAAAELYGGLSNSWVTKVPRVQPWLQDLSARTQTALGEQRWDQLVQQGTRLTATEAAEFAERVARKHLG